MISRNISRSMSRREAHVEFYYETLLLRYKEERERTKMLASRASTMMTVIGIIAALTGQVFGAGKRVYFVLILTSLILIFGLNLVGFLEINFPVLVKQFPQSEKHNAITYPFLLGLVFAFASTPCSTPILAGIMAAASISANIAYAAVMLFLFSLGQGLILVFAGVLTSKLKTWKNFYKISDLLLKFSNIVTAPIKFFL